MKFLRFWFPVVLYSVIIFYVSSIPNITSPLDIVNFDKVIHIIEYIPFGFLLARGIGSLEKKFSLKDLWFLIVIFSFLQGLSDEYHQSFVVGREASFIDLIADLIGGMIGGYLYIILTNVRCK